jgi:hypothetical protein
MTRVVAKRRSHLVSTPGSIVSVSIFTMCAEAKRLKSCERVDPHHIRHVVRQVGVPRMKGLESLVLLGVMRERD